MISIPRSDQFLADVGHREDAHDLAVELVDDRLRRSGRRHHGKP